MGKEYEPGPHPLSMESRLIGRKYETDTIKKVQLLKDSNGFVIWTDLEEKLPIIISVSEAVEIVNEEVK